MSTAHITIEVDDDDMTKCDITLRGSGHAFTVAGDLLNLAQSMAGVEVLSDVTPQLN